MSTRELINALVGVTRAEELLAQLKAEVKQQLREELAPGDRWSAILEDGTDIGSVQFKHGTKAKLQVQDRQAFVRWVEKYHPGEIVPSMPTVRKSFEDAVLSPTFGEIPDGVGWSNPGAPYLALDARSEEQKAAVDAALRDGRLRPLDGPVTALTAAHRDGERSAESYIQPAESFSKAVVDGVPATIVHTKRHGDE